MHDKHCTISGLGDFISRMAFGGGGGGGGGEHVLGEMCSNCEVLVWWTIITHFLIIVR